MKHPAKKPKKTALVYKNKKQKRKNRASSGKPAVRAAGSLSSGKIKNDFLPISCRHPYHRRKKEKFDFPTFPRLSSPHHRHGKEKLVFPVFPFGYPLRKIRKAKLVFPVSPAVGFCVCRSLSFSLLFPRSAFLTNPHRQPFSITNPLRACLPRLSPAPKKVCRQPFPLALPSLLFRPSLLFPQSPNGFMPCPFPAPACFFFPSSAPRCLSANSKPFSNPEPYFLSPFPSAPSLWLPSVFLSLPFFSLQSVFRSALPPLRLVSFPTFHKPWILTKKTAPHRTRFFCFYSNLFSSTDRHLPNRRRRHRVKTPPAARLFQPEPSAGSAAWVPSKAESAGSALCSAPCSAGSGLPFRW